MRLQAALFVIVTVSTSSCLSRKPSSTSSDAATSRETHFKNVKIFDGEKILQASEVLIKDNQIVGIGTHLNPSAGATIIDGTGKTLLPGLIDAHVHVSSAEDLGLALMAGVTTELDMMAIPETVKSLQSKLARGEITGSSFLSAGFLATAPGGHGTEYGFPVPMLTSPGDASSFVSMRKTEGSDYLKIVYDDGRGYAPGMFKSISKDTLNALVKAAHEQQLLSVVHVQSYSEALDAVKSGADGLVHLFGDDLPGAEFRTAILQNKTWVTPTLSILKMMGGLGQGRELIADPHLAPLITPVNAAALRRSVPLPGNTRFKYPTLAAATKAILNWGVPILAGTDSGNPGTIHGVSLHGELELLVNAGLSPMGALAAATAAPARAFGLKDRGQISIGQRADLLLVHGDPTKDIKDTRKIESVWKAGVQVERTGFLKSVAFLNLEFEKLRITPPPQGLGDGMVSNFDQAGNEPTTQFGSGWTVISDSDFGGMSTATMQKVSPGAQQSSGALRIQGNVKPGPGMMLAGAGVFLGKNPSDAVNLTSKPTLSFWAKTDKNAPFRIGVMSVLNPTPLFKFLTGTGEWQRFEIPLTDFDGIEPFGIKGLFFGRGSQGNFDIMIDDVQFQ